MNLIKKINHAPCNFTITTSRYGYPVYELNMQEEMLVHVVRPDAFVVYNVLDYVIYASSYARASLKDSIKAKLRRVL